MISRLASSLETEEVDYGFENHGGCYYFYDKLSGKTPRYYQHLLSEAKTRIDIWDPFFTTDSAQIFDEVTQEGITINILTKLNTYRNQTKEEINDFADKIKNILNKNGVTPSLYIYCYIKKTFDHIWHDRYLIIDEKDVYLIGTSIDEQINPQKDFGIYKMTPSIEDCTLIKDKMKKCKDNGIQAGPTQNMCVRH